MKIFQALDLYQAVKKALKLVPRTDEYRFAPHFFGIAVKKSIRFPAGLFVHYFFCSFKSHYRLLGVY